MTCSHAFSSALDAPVTPFFRARSHASCSRTAQAPITLHRAQMRKTRKELKAKVIIFTAQSSTLSQLLTPFCLGAEHLRSKETRLFRGMEKKNTPTSYFIYPQLLMFPLHRERKLIK